MKIAMLQMLVQAGKPQENEEHAFSMMEEAAANAEVLVLPEMWNVGYNFRNLEEDAVEENSPLLQRFSAFAKEKQAVIIAGSVPYRENNRIYNRTFVFDQDGTVLASYDKLHIFSLLSEPRYFTGGNAMTTFPLKGETAGLSICYDLRFPELYREMAMKEAGIIFVPAQWPSSRGLPWKVLSVARAIENQVYICAVNAVGRYKDNRFFGHSLFVAPDGTILREGGMDEEILYAKFEKNFLHSARSRMAVWQDRRTDIYG